MTSSSSSSRVVERGEEEGGAERNMTSLDSVKASESADRVREGREPVEGVERRAQNALSRWFEIMCPCCSLAESTVSSQTWYHSTRIQRMMEKRGEFSSEMESEIEASKVHWSEVDGAVSDAAHSATANREYMEVLRRRRYVREGGQLVAIDEDHPQFNLFLAGDSFKGLVVGEKVVEEGQAEIYAARDGDDDSRLLVKVFKAGSVLQHLEKQLPPALLKYYQFDSEDGSPIGDFRIITICAMLLRDERFLDRFAFVMERRWGDLRKLIDERMMEYSRNQGPPFPLHVAFNLMWKIADDMRGLHMQEPPILHCDLKAANVLVPGIAEGAPELSDYGFDGVSVADFECSVGVVGTGLWRAPEILQQLTDSGPMANQGFTSTKACDVYSYGMTCYEIVSGHI